jgi:hypothetical protein
LRAQQKTTPQPHRCPWRHCMNPGLLPAWQVGIVNRTQRLAELCISVRIPTMPGNLQGHFSAVRLSAAGSGWQGVGWCQKTKRHRHLHRAGSSRPR